MDFFNKLIDQYDQLKYELLAAQTFSEAHFGFPPIYYKILESDHTRVHAFAKAFEHYDFRDKVVCEAGAGTLALAKHFLPVVKKAYLIESNPELKDLIIEELDQQGWLEKVEFIQGDARYVELPEPIDYLVGELMSIYCGNEYQVPIFKHLRQFLKPGGRLLPEFIFNVVQLAHADFAGTHKHYPINFMRHLPEQLSLQQVINVIDLYTVEEQLVEQVIEITPTLSGIVNCVYLHSWIQIAEGHNFTGTDTLMPPTVCQLETPVQVKKGQKLRLHMCLTYGTSLDEAKFWVGKML